MALQGSLREFSVTEILQLLGTQKKTGCLFLEWNEHRALFYVLEGRMVSTRQPGMAKDDPLLGFLLRTHRLSDEQHRGILTIQRESNRDLEDLLVNGRYLSAEELGAFIERQMLDDLMRVMSWADGTYSFDPNSRWPNQPLTRLGVEAAMIEVSRRSDELKRFAKLTGDPHQLVGVRDLPDADEHLSEEECELFGIIDGRHTLAEIVDAAPLAEYEAYEALQRMLEAGWIEIVGRRDPGLTAVLPVEAPDARAAGRAVRRVRPPAMILARELAVGALTLVIALGMRFGASHLEHGAPVPAARDPYAAAQLRQLTQALDLYRREHGHYPRRLNNLCDDGWVAKSRVRALGPTLRYRPHPDRDEYELDLAPGS